MVREALIRIRREFYTERTRFAAVVGTVFMLSMSVGLALDAFTEFSGLWMILRSVILVPLAGSMFAACYAIGLLLHQRQKDYNEEWVPFRLRYSPAWRRRIALLVSAFLVLIVYASEFRVGYTFSSAIVLTVVFALLAFIRTTREEALREELNIPDERDVRYEKLKAKRAEAQELRKKQKEAEEDDDE